MALAAIAPVLVVAAKAKRPYIIGLMFFAAWILPTTFWFYSFMNPFVAAAASVGWVFLMANIFWIFRIKKLPIWAKLLIICAVWVAWTFARMRLPVVEDWWLPHLGYAVWRNTGILQLASVGGEMTVEFVVLFVNSALAFLWLGKKYWPVAIVGATFLVAAIGANFWVSKLPTQDYSSVIAVQSNGDFNQIKAMTEKALSKFRNKSEIITVVWPENHLSDQDTLAAAEFAKNAKIVLVINATDGDNHNVVEIYNQNGEKVLQNLKFHIAPDEYHASGWSNNTINDMTAFTCYDVHFPDIVARVGAAKTVFVPLNDSDFAATEKTFHLADIAFRATQSRANFVAASVDGPTAFVDKYGRVLQELPYGTIEVLPR